MTDLEGCTAWPVEPEPKVPTDKATAAQWGGGVMAELSPAARAIVNAAVELDYGQPTPILYRRLAAALRAAAYQVAPARPVLDSCCEHFEQAIRHKLLAIAAELEGTYA